MPCRIKLLPERGGMSPAERGKRKHPMIDDTRKQFLLHRASALCEEHGARLLYLTLSGSLLHGTARPGLSDIDARGLFLPSLKSLALGEAPSHLNFSTARPGERNTAQDMDICLWPVARWLLELLPAGDSDALELLFLPHMQPARCTGMPRWIRSSPSRCVWRMWPASARAWNALSWRWKNPCPEKALWIP